MTYTVGIFVFDNVEVLDFAGPYEVFTTAARVYARTHAQDDALFEVFTIASTLDSICTRAGLVIQADYAFDHPPLDVLIIPGGEVTAEMSNDAVINWLAQTAASTGLTASVCTGAFLLAKAGLLTHKSATTHWEDIDELKALFPELNVLSQKRWVDEGNIVTSAGISAGIDMCLHLVERLAGRKLAELTAKQMEFDWTENR